MLAFFGHGDVGYLHCKFVVCFRYRFENTAFHLRW